ncbi:MAG: hypothetical protein GM46_0175 [actinobacterium acAcidi]|nr:MAG: hypothetical protein GM46_0175 [actinobacterium acAcidi]
MVGRLSRARPSNAFENDARIRDMATTQLAQDGLEGLTLGNVARNLGMSHTAMTKRYDDLDDLLCDLWVHVGQPQIDRILTWVFAEVERLSDPTSVSQSSVEPTIFRKTKEKSVMLELLVLAPTRPKLRTCVRDAFEERLGDTLRTDPVAAVKVVFLFAVVLGVQAELRTTQAHQELLVAVLSEVITAMAEPGEVVELPKVDASHMGRYAFDTGDERRDRILLSCLENVSSHGLVGTTTKAIARVAGVSEGLIFSMFDSKTDVFFEATALQSKLGYQANLDFVMSLNEKHGTGVGNAILIREWLSPRLSKFRAALLEEIRLTWHDVDLWRRIQNVKQELVSDVRLAGKKASLTPLERAVQVVTLAVPIGIYIVGEVLPEAVGLPFSVVTLPVFRD